MFGWMLPTLHGNRVTPLIRGRGHTGVVVIDYPGDLQIWVAAHHAGTAWNTLVSSIWPWRLFAEMCRSLSFDLELVLSRSPVARDFLSPTPCI